MGLFSDADFLFFDASAGRSRPVWRPLLQHLAQVRAVQALCAQPHLRGGAFVAELLRQLQITVSYEPAALRRLPSQGAFITVANQSAGLLDELALLHILGQRRPDLRLVASEALTALFPQLASQLVPANAARRAGGQILPTSRQVLRYLHNDVPVAFFASSEEQQPTTPLRPAPALNGVSLVGKILSATHVPVVPVGISHQGGRAHFGWFGFVQPWLRPMSLPAELLNQRGSTLHVQIGPAFSGQELAYLPPAARWPCVRARVAALREWPAAVAESWPRLPAQTVAAATAAHLIEAELAALSPARRLLVHGPWEVYVAR